MNSKRSKKVTTFKLNPKTAAPSNISLEKLAPSTCAADATTVPGISHKPEILAPAGDMKCAFAALAAGADAVYLGLKHFSARMQAENFSSSELTALTSLAHSENRKVYVAMNTLVKAGESPQAFRLIKRLSLDTKPDALIVQDPAMLYLARQAGFEGELHLSTLANLTHQKSLECAKSLGADRVILPRELSLAECGQMDAACPAGLGLEFFVHGALCYCISGRCWWSSYMGGKSGLRGRCVQPCRRLYKQKNRQGRFFSCLDFSLDQSVTDLLALQNIRSWKIEGRKKGPHYVYHVTAAYKLLRDEPGREAAMEASRLLELALGRPGTKALFHGAGAENVTAGSGAKDLQTSSGYLLGKVFTPDPQNYSIKTKIPLLPKDFLRIGYEDEPWHATISLSTPVPENGICRLSMPRGKHPKAGTPVFLIDRRSPELVRELHEWNNKFTAVAQRMKKSANEVAELMPEMPKPGRFKGAVRKQDIILRSSLPHGKEGKAALRPGSAQGLWLSQKALRELSQTLYSRISWWLPPVIWPDEEDFWQKLIRQSLRGGALNFVLNSPWQIAFFQKREPLNLTAGPFCNIANAPALALMAELGFKNAIVSPELGKEDYLSLPGQSPIPLGIVLTGYWPVGITRHRQKHLDSKESIQSPKGEEFWTKRYGPNTWLYPAWPLDLSPHRPALEKAGFSTFVHMDEHPPESLNRVKRKGEFNYNIDVL